MRRTQPGLARSTQNACPGTAFAGTTSAGVEDRRREVSDLGTIRSEAEIRHDVADALKGDARLNASVISVEVVGRDVILRGTVPTYEQKQVATEVATRVRDVLNVRNELEVTTPVRRSDQAITQDVQGHLERDVWVDQSHITVKTVGGMVHLSGTVDSCGHRAYAEQAARRVPGVVEVVDELVVEPMVAREDGVIAEEVLQVVAGDPRIDASNVAVDVQNGVAHLRGAVPTGEQKRLAAHHARWVPGVRQVVDELEVAEQG